MNWKNTLKQRTMSRMKEARGEALKKAREDGTLAGRVRDVMQEELNQLKSAREVGFVQQGSPMEQGEDYINLMRLLEEEIMGELHQQEQELLREYEEIRRFEEEELQASVNLYYGGGGSGDHNTSGSDLNISGDAANNDIIPCMFLSIFHFLHSLLHFLQLKLYSFPSFRGSCTKKKKGV